MRSSIHQADFSGNGKSIAEFVSDEDALKNADSLFSSSYLENNLKKCGPNV